jgi:hypothetical protein
MARYMDTDTCSYIMRLSDHTLVRARLLSAMPDVHPNALNGASISLAVIRICFRA